jgi:glutaredoxin-like protein
MSLTDKTGVKVPEVTFKIRSGHEWNSVTTNELFTNKKVVVFALPGAFTPTCSSTHLPRYNELYDSFKDLGVDDVVCLSVNDSFVMNQWQKEQKAEKITMLPDGNGEFSEKLGFLVNKSDLGFGKRSWRYSMYVVDGIIEKMFIESEVAGDPFDQSDADTMIHYLNKNYQIPKSVAIFTREGCSFCYKAKQILKENGVKYEEHVLGEDYSIKTLVAISGSTMVPQIFIQGKRIGGHDELRELLVKELK